MKKKGQGSLTYVQKLVIALILIVVVGIIMTTMWKRGSFDFSWL